MTTAVAGSRPQPEAWTVSTPGPSGTASMVQTEAPVCTTRRSQSVCKRGKVESSAPQVVARVVARSASSASRSVMRSRRRRGSTATTRASSSTRSNRTRSPPASQGSHDSIPSKSSPSASRSHCSRPQGCSATNRAARVRTSSSGSSSRQGYNSTSDRDTVARWSATPNSVRRSTSSPHRSIRTGASSVDGQTSRIDPRTASSPRCSTWYSRR